MKYAFIRAHREEFGIRAMCRVLRVHFSGFYAWLKEPLSHRAQEDARQTELIWQAWADSGKVYGYRKLTDDLRDQGEQVSENRVARLASLAGIAAQVGYRRRPGRYGGKPAVVAENRLEQVQHDRSRSGLGDRHHLHQDPRGLAVSVCRPRPVLAPCRRPPLGRFALQIACRAMGYAQPRMTTDLASQSLLMAVWRRKPAGQVMVHSDQGSQFTSREWQTFLRQHGLEPSMSRREDCPPLGSMLCMRLPGSGQRGRGELLPRAETGAGQASHLSNPRSCKAGRVRIHRDVLQFEAKAHEQRHAVAPYHTCFACVAGNG